MELATSRKLTEQQKKFWANIYEEYVDLLAKRMNYRLQNSELASDIVQNVFEKLMLNFTGNKFNKLLVELEKDPKALIRYVNRSLTNAMIDYFRSTQNN